MLNKMLKPKVSEKKKEQKAAKPKIITAINFLSFQKALYCNDLMWKAWKVYLTSHQFLMNDIIQIQLHNAVSMYMAFLLDGHYFFFYISRQNFVLSNVC